jgi:hypothetical protein
MDQQSNAAASSLRHASPNLGAVAAVFVLLKMASLFPVTIFGVAVGFKPPFFPPITASADQISAYFSIHSFEVLILASLQFGAVIPLGIFTASVVSRLRFLGITAAGGYIALFGGFMAALDEAASAAILWVLAHPSFAQDSTLVRALHTLSFIFGGPGFTVPFGLLMAGVSITAGFSKLLPKWVVVLGLILAITGELSWFNLLIPKAIILIPFTRFLGFVWMIAAGFKLPKTVRRVAPQPA